MTKTLYDPEVEKRGIEKGLQQGLQQGIEQGIMAGKLESARNLLDILDDETISIKLGLELETVKKLRLESMN